MVSRTLPTIAAALAATTVIVDGYANFAALLPNGDKVPGVAAIGHTNVKGGGANNQFGLDFSSGGSTWSPVLCQLDSDGDGATNGEELGDPCCKWTQGLTPHSSSATSPGHKNTFSSAQLAALKCPTSPTSAPSPNPSPYPSPVPSPNPSPAPSPTPSPKPSPAPSPTPSPSSNPTEDPSEDPTEDPSEDPSDDPTDEPSPSPSSHPTPRPSNGSIPTSPPNTDCVKISVMGDATYCIPGPICVGAHDYPAGKNCPKKGDVAGQDCVGGIPSYSNGQCILTVDAVCEQMKDGVWGCMLPGGVPTASPSNSSTTVKMAVAASTDLSPRDYTGYFIAGGTVAAVAAVALAVLIVKKVRKQNSFTDGCPMEIQHNAETPVL